LRSLDFFAVHPVFTHAEFVAAHTATGRSRHTSNTLLAKHLASGRLVRVRRGLYASVPRGVDPATLLPDPFLIATKVRDDAVLAYHTALAYHGRAYSIWRRYQYATAARPRPFTFRGREFAGVQVPAAVRGLPAFGGGALVQDHAGGQVRVTTLERTLVDVLDAPREGGGWEEIWRSLELVEFFDLDAVTAYALTLGSALTIARVGFYLEQHRDPLMVEDQHLAILRAHAPAQPRYLDSRRTSGTLVAGWNLVVPEYVLQRGWEEAA